MLIVFEALQCLHTGEDIQILTPEARKDIPFSFEAKFRKKVLRILTMPYEQAARQEHAVSSTLSNTPVAAIQQKGFKRLIVLYEDDFLNLSIIRAYVL